MSRPLDGPDAFDRLLASAASDRGALLLSLAREHPGEPLVLPAENGRRAVLEGADLAGSAGAAATALRAADLRGMNGRACVLDGMNLQQAVLREADLANARLQGALLDEADFTEALLEDADLNDVSARFGNFERASLESATLRKADLWGARLVDADLRNADLRDVTLIESDLTGADLRGVLLSGASLERAQLSNADLSGVDLESVSLDRADLSGAHLADSRLRGKSLAGCMLRHAHLSGAWLDRTDLRVDQLGGVVGEEIERRYVEAARSYLSLERNFTSLGDHGSARWAYRRRRRMEKLGKRRGAGAATANHEWAEATRSSVGYVADELAELVCDYGESVVRVLGTLFVVFATFAVVYLVSGSMVRVDSGSVSRNPVDAIIFSLGGGTTGGLPTVGLRAGAVWVHLVTGLQAVLSISLTGLLGFVLGNRIRR